MLCGLMSKDLFYLSVPHNSVNLLLGRDPELVCVCLMWVQQVVMLYRLFMRRNLGSCFLLLCVCISHSSKQLKTTKSKLRAKAVSSVTYLGRRL